MVNHDEIYKEIRRIRNNQNPYDRIARELEEALTGYASKRISETEFRKLQLSIRRKADYMRSLVNPALQKNFE